MWHPTSINENFLHYPVIPVDAVGQPFFLRDIAHIDLPYILRIYAVIISILYRNNIQPQQAAESEDIYGTGYEL